MVNIYRGDGALVRRLVQGEQYAAGAHKLTWDGQADDGAAVEAGEYTWKGLFHEGIGLKLRGWVGSGSDMPWVTAEGKGGWGGDRGAPSAVAADDKQVYLGWSMAERGKSVLACDPAGHVVWAHRRSEGPSGCKALAVDDGLVYVLGGLENAGAEGGAIYRLNANDGTPVPWPNGSLDLKIPSFWPADGKMKPDVADAMAVRHGHMYLSFTSSQFLTILDAKTGAYLQTVVGAPPGMIDVAPTKTELPDAPGKLSDADFAVIALKGNLDPGFLSTGTNRPNVANENLGQQVLGRILFAHDPFWVITSDLAPLHRDAPVTALTVIGDHGKFHPRTAFVGLGAPNHQVEARSLLEAEEAAWIAGRQGGRALLGPWQPDGLRSVRGVALASDGKLWVAESDAFPKRFSVWDTTGKQGKLVREFFGPVDRENAGCAINPLDPDVMFAQGCEWRIDRKTGTARCLGVVTRESAGAVRYGAGKNGHAYLIVTRMESPSVDIFERLGDGEYKVRTRIFQPTDSDSSAFAGKTVMWADENGDGKMQDSEMTVIDEVPGVWGFGLASSNLALTAMPRNADASALTIVHSVKEWSACGAPRYDFKNGTGIRFRAEASADLQLALEVRGGLACVGTGKDRATHWEVSDKQFNGAVPREITGSALLPPPIRNVWLVTYDQNGWELWTEDGFNLVHFFAQSGQEAQWPKVPAPGAEMVRAGVPQSGGLAQARDGKLYVEAADMGCWNMEVTGLEKVKALLGGKVTVSSAR